MSVSVQRFKKEFPEFKKTSDTIVEQKLASALGRISPTIWGTQADAGQMILTAHLLSISPSGEMARLKPENRKTLYKIEFDSMVREITMGAGRVI